MNQYLEYVAMGITAVVSLGGMITGFIALRNQRKKDISEATESIAEAAKTLIEPLRQRVIHLEDENKKLKATCTKFDGEIQSLKKSLEDFKAGANRLIHQLKALNAVPVWNPEEERGEK